MNCRTAEAQIFAGEDRARESGLETTLSGHLAECPSCRHTRDELAATIQIWRTTAQAISVPEPRREWEELRRRMRGGASTAVIPATQSWRQLLAWLALPLAAAAAALIVLLNPTVTLVHARAEAVEVSAGDGAVVLVDDQSGWVVIWEAESGAPRI